MISAFILSTSGGDGGGDEEHDRSLLFAFSPSPAAKASSTTLKGLGLAVRGVLESICGEKTRILRLRQQQHGEITAVFAHLKVCMVVLTLPGHLPDPIACSLVLQLAQSMVLLAGPSTMWTELHSDGGATYAKIKKPLQSLFDRLCDGVLRQVAGPGWSRGLPACVLQPGFMSLQLPPERHLELDAMLRAHEAGGLVGLSTPPVAHGAQMQYNFYSRSCCLMYRGLTVWSGLAPIDTRLTWQLCWALGAHGQAQSLPCQVTMHRIYPTAPRVDASAVDAGGSRGTEASAAGALGQSHAYSLLILVSACHMVLGVVLTAYDEDIEELAGQVEAHAAVELLAKLHNAFILDLGQASAASALLTFVSRAPPDAAAAGGGPDGAGPPGSGYSSPHGTVGRPKTPGHHNSLFMRIISRSKPGGSKAGGPRGASPLGGPQLQDGSHHGGGAEADGGDLHSPATTNSSGEPSPRTHSANSPAASLAEAAAGAAAAAGPSPPYRHSQSARTPSPAAEARPATPPNARLSTRPAEPSIAEHSPSGSNPHTPGSGHHPGGHSAGTPSTSNKVAFSFNLETTPSVGRGARAGASGASSPTALVYSRAASGRSNAGGGGGAAEPSPYDAAPNLAATHAVVQLEAETKRIVTLGDIPHISMVPDVWDTIAVCRAMFENGCVAVSAPPKHSRLCMTIQQIEQLSATRSQREGGQRLGSADAMPWQYHPEVAGLATVQQVTRKLESSKQVLGPRGPAWLVTAFKASDGNELYVVHADEVDEQQVMHDLLVGGGRKASMLGGPGGVGAAAAGGQAVSSNGPPFAAAAAAASAARMGAASRSLVFA